MAEMTDLETAIQQAWDQSQAAYEVLLRDGPVVHSSHGPRKSPAAQLWRDNLLLWARLRNQAAEPEDAPVDPSGLLD